MFLQKIFLFFSILLLLLTESSFSEEALCLIRGDELRKSFFKNTLYTSRGVVLCDDSYAGEVITEPISIPFDCEEVIPSVVIETPDDSSFDFYLRFIGVDGVSPWLWSGTWKREGYPEIIPNKFAYLLIDYFNLLKPVRIFQIKVNIYRSRGRSPVIRGVNISASSKRFDSPGRLYYLNHPPAFRGSLSVPFRSQSLQDPAISSELCSPVSCGMVLEYYGDWVSSAELARKIYFPEYNMYGIWWRAIEGCAQYGFYGWVQHFSSWSDVDFYLKKGVPVIACILFGELSAENEGHVVVISGFDKAGNPICRDCAYLSAKDGIRNYNRKEFERAWFYNGGGVGYIIENKYKEGVFYGSGN